MSESQNPFDAAMNQIGGNNGNPFEQTAATSAQPQAVSLGSETAAPNPFDIPAAVPVAATQIVQQPQAPAEVQTPTATPVAMTPPAAPVTPPPATPLTNDETGQVQLPFGAEAQSATQQEAAHNPIAAVLGIEEAETQASIFEKPPVFEHGSVKEEIEDIKQTFEDLRVAKAEDFPELEDANRVSWEVSYGKIRKMVYSADAKKKKIGEFKATIETSKEFIDALKKSKEKAPVCVIKAKVTAQSKGEKMPVYKGVFTNFEEAAASDKTICIVPSSDGKVYEIRKEETGTFIMPLQWCKELSEVEAGFTPALPLIPRSQLLQVITFFRSLLFTDAGGSYEAIANIVWDRVHQVFCIRVPKQTVSAVRADSDLTQDDVLDNERYLHYMDIHSHNLMGAQFSHRDDRDEKATRLYTVIGRLDQYLPEISVRMGCGGKHLPINPNEVFEPIWEEYPEDWHNRLTFSETAHKRKYDQDLLCELDALGEPEDLTNATDMRTYLLWRKGLMGDAA